VGRRRGRGEVDVQVRVADVGFGGGHPGDFAALKQCDRNTK
jgi:16S rRNA G527 N7-methylase RsmG